MYIKNLTLMYMPFIRLQTDCPSPSAMHSLLAGCLLLPAAAPASGDRRQGRHSCWAGLGWAGLGMFTNGAAARAVEDNVDWAGDGECRGDSEEVDRLHYNRRL